MVVLDFQRGFHRDYLSVLDKCHFIASVLHFLKHIRDSGRIETPAILRPVDDGYEMISGHRRKLACTLAGLDSMPVIIRVMTDDEAIIAMFRANKQREEVLPSEKARAYKMWLDAMNRQGERTDLTCATILHKLDGEKSDGKKSREIIAENEGISHEQVRKYISLNNLIPEFLQMVDDDFVDAKGVPTMGFSVGTELASLSEENQRNLLETMESEVRTPSVAQAQEMKRLSDKDKENAKNAEQNGGEAKVELDMDKIFEIMKVAKPNQVDKLKIPYDRIRQFFPADCTAKKMEDVIVKLLESWYRKRELERSDAR